MNIRFITKTIHSYLDYPVALSLIALPGLLGLGQSNALAFWLATTTGVAALLLTLLTDHKTGVLRVVPYKFHLAVDFLVGVTFVAAPFVLGFQGVDAWFYLANGAAVLVVVGLHKPSQSDAMNELADSSSCATASA